MSLQVVNFKFGVYNSFSQWLECVIGLCPFYYEFLIIYQMVMTALEHLYHAIINLLLFLFDLFLFRWDASDLIVLDDFLLSSSQGCLALCKLIAERLNLHE